jgi:hypothetical protein
LAITPKEKISRRSEALIGLMIIFKGELAADKGINSFTDIALEEFQEACKTLSQRKIQSLPRSRNREKGLAAKRGASESFGHVKAMHV